MTTSAASSPALDAGSLDELCINTIRGLAVDAVERANSGHPGMPMGAAPMAYVLWTRFLRHNPTNPAWPDRDRFVLSAGHASMLLYALLHLTGYEVPLEELKRFRGWGSITPGHPEHGRTPGVETTTGPLGQGFANAVGMAIGERLLASRFNRPGVEVVDHHTYILCSDGDMMEGVASEAASLAGHLGLGKLICLYDDNGISIDGPTDLSFGEDVGLRFEAYGWHVHHVPDGNDDHAIEASIAAAREETQHPSLIVVTTHIASGAPSKQGSAEAHGAPLGSDEVRAWKQRIGWPESEFFVPSAARRRLREAARARGIELETAWQARFARWAAAEPGLAAEWDRVIAGRLPAAWERELPRFVDVAALSTRTASGKVLAAIAPTLPELVGGSADLTESTNVALPGERAFSARHPGRLLHFGVREHAMGAILNGLSLHGGFRSFGSTFLVFSDYMRPSIRLAALMRLPVIYVLTHDSIGLGEDGPTHQPVEQLASLRAIPGLVVIRPADAAETVEAWKVALERREGPTALVLSRQDVPALDRGRMAPPSLLARGAYVLVGSPGDELILMATGSEVHVAAAAADLLRSEHGVSARVVGVPSWELFELQGEPYRHSVLPPKITVRLAVEAASPFGWSRWVGPAGDVLGVDRFGASARGPIVLERYGFAAEALVARALNLLRTSRSSARLES